MIDIPCLLQVNKTTKTMNPFIKYDYIAKHLSKSIGYAKK